MGSTNEIDATATAANVRDERSAREPSPRGTGLHDIWGMSNTTTEVWLSIAVVLVFAAGLVAIAVRSFTRSAVS